MKVKSVVDKKQLERLGRKQQLFHKSIIVDATLYGGNHLPYACFQNNSSISILLASNLLEIIPAHSFERCINLKRIDACCGTIGENAFSHCDNLQDFNFEAIGYLGANAFENSGVVKANLKLCKIIPNAAFKDCFSLRETSIPMAESIGDFAFENCNIDFIIFGPNLKSIGKNAFFGNPLKTVIFTSEEPPEFHELAFGNAFVRQVILDKKCNKDAYTKALPSGFKPLLKGLDDIQIKDIFSL